VLRYEQCVFSSLLQGEIGNILEFPYISIRNQPRLLAIKYNSAWHDKPSEFIHCGKIEDEQFNYLEQQLSLLPFDDNQIRLFLLHHHPIAYKNPVPSELDFSQLTNSSRLLRILQQNNFDFLIHGHTHQPVFNFYSADADFHIGILASGSFSIDLPKEWRCGISNQFHVVQFDSRDTITKQVKGSVLSWAYYISSNWIKSSKEKGGIPHVESFGLSLNHNILCGQLRGILEQLFSQTSLIEWGQLGSTFPDLRYIRPNTLEKALTHLASEMNFRIFDKNTQNPALLKNGDKR